MFDFKKIESIYHPYKINLKGNVVFFETSSGKFVLKDVKKDLFSLYGYLQKVGFDLVPNLDRNFDNKQYVQEYIDSVFLPTSQYFDNMGKDLGSLHYKTAQDKIISLDDINNLKDIVEENLNYLLNKYTLYFKDTFLKKYYSPSEYLFMRNFSVIYNNINLSLQQLDSWYNDVLDDKTMRICLLHNNISKEHYIASKDKNYFISFDNYSFDLPVFDLVEAFKNMQDDDMYDIFYKGYLSEFNLNENEKNLLYILLLVPPNIELNNDFKSYQNFISYNFKSLTFIKEFKE